MESIDFFTIKVEQTDWNTSSEVLKSIRHQVFVQEQQVPESLDVDEYDPTATHWIAFNAENQPMATARMRKNGHIGRMAVLKKYRDLGVGSAVMRHIIRFAEQQHIKELHLDAQKQALGFYQGIGFEIIGNEFMEAGIPHVAMQLDVHKSTHPGPEPKLPDISEEQRQRKPIDGLEVFLVRARKMAKKAETKIRIFTVRMDPAIYSDKELCQAFFDLASRHPNAEIRVLVKDNQFVRSHSIGLADLSQRLSSHITIRKFPAQLDTLHNEFILFDGTGIIYQQELRRYVGYSVDYAPLQALELIQEFDQFWEQSLNDPEARRLHI